MPSNFLVMYGEVFIEFYLSSVAGEANTRTNHKNWIFFFIYGGHKAHSDETGHSSSH